MKYARIVAIFASESGLKLEDALSFFYDSDTYKLISEGIADMHCRSDEYLADELMMEFQEKSNQGTNRNFTEKSCTSPLQEI